MTVKRDSMEFDTLIIGAGPAGLSAAIRLAQHTKQSIAIIEKGASIGAHLLSGAALDPRALSELIPDWQKQKPDFCIPAKKDRFYLLNKKRAWRLPTPPTMNNKGNYIISLGQFCKWLASYAESLGVNIFPGFSGSEVLFDSNNQVIGVQTNDIGIEHNGKRGERFQPGIHLLAKHTLFAEGCRGSLSETLIQHYQLREHCDPQTYAIGLKELWKINPDRHDLGTVLHTVGWPLDKNTYGGSFVYHADANHLAIGFVIGLDYQNPYLNPFKTFQQFKTHPLIRRLLEGGECLEYGARALNEGGLQSLPKLSFPGGLLIGCSAGFLNVGKIKGIHTAMQSGILAADAVTHKQSYDALVQSSWIHEELDQVRNLRPAFKKGLWPGLAYAAVDQYLLRGSAPWTLHHTPSDHKSLKKKTQCSPIQYPKPDGNITFDLMTQVFRSGTRHHENQPCHLIIKNKEIPVDYNLKYYDAPEQRYCPAGVYEIVLHGDTPRLQINASNCVHCKTCDIKDPKQNIVWETPEGGDGPNYTFM